MQKSALGDRIASARERAGMNKNQLARELGTSWQHVDHWEKGRTEPSLSSLRRIGEVLRVSMDTLLGVEDGPASSSGRHSALERFFTEREDLTPNEEEWLRRAPIDPAQAAPDDYRKLLDNLRRIAQRSVTSSSVAPRSVARGSVAQGSVAQSSVAPGSVAPGSVTPGPKSGRRRRVDPAALEGAIAKRRTGRP